MEKDNFLRNLSNLRINYFEKDMRLNYTDCNESTAELAGLDSPSQIKGKSDYEFMWKDTSAESFRKTDREAIAGKPQINHFESILVSTGLKDFLITKTNLLDKNDNVIGIVGCNICVSGFTLTKKIGNFSAEEQRLYLGEAFGNETLTKRQVEVFKCLLHANTEPETASFLKLSIVTVRAIIKELKRKLQCSSKAEIVLTAIKNGWTFLIGDQKRLPELL